MHGYTLKCLSRSVTLFVTACTAPYPASVTDGDKRGDKQQLPLDPVANGVGGHLVTNVTDFWVNLLVCAPARVHTLPICLSLLSQKKESKAKSVL